MAVVRYIGFAAEFLGMQTEVNNKKLFRDEGGEDGDPISGERPFPLLCGRGKRKKKSLSGPRARNEPLRSGRDPISTYGYMAPAYSTGRNTYMLREKLRPYRTNARARVCVTGVEMLFFALPQLFCYLLPAAAASFSLTAGLTNMGRRRRRAEGGRGHGWR